MPPIAADAVDGADARLHAGAPALLPHARADAAGTTSAPWPWPAPTPATSRPTGDGTYRWDLQVAGRVRVPPGAGRAGCGGRLPARRRRRGALEPVHIETALGVEKPDSAGWEAAVRMAMCSITSHASMVRHFNWLHLTGGPVFEAVTRNHLPVDHPVRRLVWAHVFGTHGGNDLVTEILMSEGGEFDAIFSLTHRGKCQLFEATTGDFDLAAINPLTDAGASRPRRQRRAHPGSRQLERPLRRVPRPRPSVPRAVLRVRRRPRERPGARCVDRRPRRPAAARGAGRPGPGHDARRGGVAPGDDRVPGHRRARDHRQRAVGLPAVERHVAGARVRGRPPPAGRRVPAAGERQLQPERAPHDAPGRRDARPGRRPRRGVGVPGAPAGPPGVPGQARPTAPAPWRMEPRRLKANINA